MLTRQNLRNLSWPILIEVAILLTIGVAFIHSGSGILTGPEGEAIRLARAKKQMVWIVLSSFVLLFTIVPHYKTFIENGFVIYGACVGLLLVLLIGARLGIFPVINGVSRWIPLGFMMLQPSELMKIGLILCLARYMQYRETHRTWYGLAVPFLLTLVPMALIMRQPDLGTALLFLPVLFSILFVAGSRLRHLVVIVGMAICVAPPMYFFVLKTYQQKRIIYFLKQSEIDSPAAMNELYQLIQSKLAIGSGGLAGKGWMEGTMNRLNFLPVRTTDFIFAVIGEEIGFAGLMFVLLVFFFFFASALSIADRHQDPSGRLLVIGMVALLATQLYINTAMTIGLMPITGLTLPFISYGGSSLISSFFLLGLILNVSMRPQATLAKDDFEYDDDIRRRSSERQEEKEKVLWEFAIRKARER